MDLETRKKISQTMKGRSNFAGHRHTHATKLQIGFSQEGHRNAKDHKWATDKESGEEHRVRGKLPKGLRWGRKASLGEAVWDNPSPAKKPNRLSAVMKARAKARAKAAGRPYPNMVDNIWAAKNESVSSDKRLEGTDSLKKLYTKDTPGQSKMKIDEAKATYCGRCGTTHVPPKFGGKCPALKEEQIVEQSSASLKKMSDYHFKQASYHDKEAKNTEHPTERRKAHALALSSHNNAGEHYLKASRADNEMSREYHVDKAEKHADSAEEKEREHNLMEENIAELNKSTLTSYLDKTVDPVHGMPRSANKLSQRLAGIKRASKKLSEIKEGQQSIDEAPSIHSSYMAGRGSSGMVGKKPNASDMATYGTYSVTVKHSDGEKKYTLKNMNDGRHAQNVAMKIHSKANPGHKISTASAEKLSEANDVPFDGPYTTPKKDEKDKSGAVHTPMSRARHLARLAMKVKNLKDSQK